MTTEPTPRARMTEDIAREKAPERTAEKAFILTLRDLCWLAGLVLVAGILLGRWL